MIKGLDVTVYEILGYLLPGVVALFALCLIVGHFEVGVLDIRNWAGLGWWLLAPVSIGYILGHLLQALANRVFSKQSEGAALASVMNELPDSSFEAIARRLQVRDAGNVITAWRTADKGRGAFLALCTALLDQDAKTFSRDLFLYREGFYRGTSLALFVLALSVAIWVWPLWRDSVQPARREHASLAAAAVLLLVWAGIEFYNRYKRFARYRIGSCVLGAVVVATSTARHSPTSPAPTTD